MKKNWATTSITIMVVSLSGCASMSSDECANSDWSAIGYEDGSRGYTSARFTNRRKACASHGVTADFQAYQDGREQGLSEFCQPGRGFNVGASGASYNGVCATDLEPEFLEAYRVGYQLYDLRSNVSNVSSLISRKKRELEKITKEIRFKEAALISAESTTEARILLLVDIKDLAEHKGRVEAEIQGLIADRVRYQSELRHYEQTVAAYGY